MNYYDLFEIAPTPIVDNTYVAKKYIELQKKYHPDFFTKENESDKDDALAKSAEVNDAYKTLKNSDANLAYYLTQKNAIQVNEKYELPAEFLMEMMELNEDVEDDDIKIKVLTYQNKLYEEIAVLLNPNADKEFSDSEIKSLKSFYFKKKYLQRILERLEE